MITSLEYSTPLHYDGHESWSPHKTTEEWTFDEEDSLFEEPLLV